MLMYDIYGKARKDKANLIIVKTLNVNLKLNQSRLQRIQLFSSFNIREVQPSRLEKVKCAQ